MAVAEADVVADEDSLIVSVDDDDSDEVVDFEGVSVSDFVGM